jgi:hypothetical protein
MQQYRLQEVQKTLSIPPAAAVVPAAAILNHCSDPNRSLFRPQSLALWQSTVTDGIQDLSMHQMVTSLPQHCCYLSPQCV